MVATTTDIFWTGGWDSTFRVLQLAQNRRLIQPHYIRDTKNDFHEKEFQIMTEIRKKINKIYPNSPVLEIKVENQKDITVDRIYTQAHKSLLSKSWIGSQYIYMASYCKQEGIQGIEVSIERAKNESEVRSATIPCLENTETDSNGNRVISGKSDTDLLCLFGQFSFPLLSTTKLDMLSEAKKDRMFEVLDMTCFCHQPLFGKPCGSCNPCIVTREAGLSYRFTKFSSLNYRLKKYVISHSKMHRLLKRLKYGKNNYSSY